MDNKWFSKLPKAEQAQRKEFVKSNQKVLDILSEICYTMDTGERVSDYDSPSWAYKQADRNGYARALRDIQSLLNVSDRETP